MNQNRVLGIALGLYVFLSAGLAYVTIKRHIGKDYSTLDISSMHLEGVRLARGENPYARILQGNMRENQKYPTYFPVIYLCSAALSLTAGPRYRDFQLLWSPVCVLSHFAIGLLLLYALGRRCGTLYGVLAAIFWALGRWPLAAMTGEFPDPPAILVFGLSLVTYQRRPRTACLLFGLSLAIKHLALFVSPLYLIWEYHRGDREDAWQRVIVALLLVMAIPAILSLPFVLWGPEGFARSIMFSGTRLAMDSVGAGSIDARIGVEGPLARIPLLLMMFLLYGMTFRGVLKFWGSATLCLAIFLAFNSVFFPVYFCWLMFLVPLAVVEWMDQKPGAAANRSPAPDMA